MPKPLEKPARCYNPAGGILMPEWLERGVNVFVGALVLVLVVKYRDKGILRRIGESKYRFRRWLKGNAK
jgi:hypothetical protein